MLSLGWSDVTIGNALTTTFDLHEGWCQFGKSKLAHLLLSILPSNPSSKNHLDNNIKEWM